MKKILFLTLFFIIFCNRMSYSQFSRDIDSFLYVNESLKDTDTNKIKNLYEIARDYYYSSPDSAILFANQAIELSKNINYDRGEADAKKAAAIGYYVKADYENSLAYFISALEIYDILNDTKSIGAINNNVGNIYWTLENYDLALEKYLQAKIAFENISDTNRLSSILMNLGAVHDQLSNLDSAFYYYNLSLEYKLIYDDFDGAAGIYNNLGFILLRDEKYNEAIENFDKAIKIFEQLDNKFNLPISYSNIAECYLKLEKYQTGYEYLEKGLNAAKEIGAVRQERDLMKGFYVYYENIGNTEKALETYITYVELKDSIFNEEINDQLTEMETKYESEKKQKEIELLQANQEKNKLTIQRQKLLVLAVFVVLISLVGFTIQIFRTSKQRKKANNLLRMKNAEISQQKEEILTQNEVLQQHKEEIEAQRDELEQQRDYVVQKNSIIETKNRQINDSINYASKIQSALLPSKQELDNDFKEYFIFYRPRDIVSGDFYWYKNIKGKKILAIGDCTGHGVPGAFMSLLGIAFLNEIIGQFPEIKSACLLEELRTKVKTSLKQSIETQSTKDGMDIVVIVLSQNKKEIEFSGANNSLFHLSNGNLVEYKGTKNPVGIYIREQNFESKIIPFQINDLIFSSSDGYLDQFNHETSEKFKHFRFKEMLLDIETKNSEQQLKTIEQKFENWKGSNNKQIDDVLVVGIRLE